MELKKFVIIYNTPDRIEPNFDQKLERALEPLGLKRWASGFDMETGDRDIAFDFKE